MYGDDPDSTEGAIQIGCAKHRVNLLNPRPLSMELLDQSPLHSVAGGDRSPAGAQAMDADHMSQSDSTQPGNYTLDDILARKTVLLRLTISLIMHRRSGFERASHADFGAASDTREWQRKCMRLSMDACPQLIKITDLWAHAGSHRLVALHLAGGSGPR